MNNFNKNLNSSENRKINWFDRLFNWYEVKTNNSNVIRISTVIILGILTTIVSGILADKSIKYYDKLTTESRKYIAVVITNKSDESFTIPQEFRIGFANDADFKSESSEQKIKFIKEDDALSLTQAELIANKLINDNNCVMIIGNSTSTLTEVTLNAILSSNKTKPGFILPIATADNIMDKAKDQNYSAILRMMPNNEQQATTIKNFIFQKFPSNPKVAIFADEDNLTYSLNLSQKVSDKLLKYNGTIILKKNYGNSNRLIDNLELLIKYKQIPDILVFVGISTNGSLLMEELKNLKLNIPVIFTDGCTVNTLMDKSKNNSSHYYISAVKKPKNENDAPTYEPVGDDARNLAKIIINGIEGDITRESVYEYINTVKTENKMLMDDGKAGNYQFNDKGENIQMHWKVYHYEKGILTLDYENN